MGADISDLHNCLIALCIGFVPWLCASSFVEDWVCIICGVLSGDRRNPSRGEGGDVELGARTSKLISVLAFGYLAKLYSLYISHYYYYLLIHV